MRLKQILLTEYIGSIIVGFLAAQGVVNLVAVLVGVLSWTLYGNQGRSVFANPQPFDYSLVIRPATSAALYFLVAFGLVRWLFGPPPEPLVEDSTDAPEA